MKKHNKRLMLILVGVTALLLIPFFVMQFSNEINWNFFDFMTMGILILATGLLSEFILRKVKSVKGRLILNGVGLLVFLLIWAELAVGIFGTPFAGN